MSEAVFDPSLKKKKKSSKKAPDFAADASSGAYGADDAAAKVSELSLEGATEEFEFKKKKKKSKPVNTVDDFEAALARAGVEDATNETEGGDASGEVAEAQSGRYEKLLSRFFDILRENNPEMAGDRSGIKYKIPPPIVGRDGNKKTLFSNIKLIADKMHRPTEHVIHFMFTELGTSGSVDGSERLVIKGRFQQGQIEGVLRRYILEYVTCKTCKSVNTRLTKENRLYFLVCNSCGSRRSVQSIKAGYQAVTRASRRAKQQ